MLVEDRIKENIKTLRLINEKMEAVRRKQIEYAEKRSLSGKIGSDKRWGSDGKPNGKPNGKMIALHTPTPINNKVSKDTLSKPDGLDVKKPCPHQDIIQLYHEILPELPRVQMVVKDGIKRFAWKGERVQRLKARWDEDEQRQNIEWWRGWFERIRRSDFLMGRTTPLPGKKPFMADIDWIFKYSNFEKIRAGKYQ